MTITEKNLAEKLAGIYGDINDYDWAAVARKAAQLLGVDLAPEPKPLPTEPGSVIIATEVRGEKGKWLAFLEPDRDWAASEYVNGYMWHHSEHITKWTPARVVPEGEPIDLGEVRKGDRVRMVLNSGAEVELTIERVTTDHIIAESIALPIRNIRTIHLLHREEA